MNGQQSRSSSHWLSGFIATFWVVTRQNEWRYLSRDVGKRLCHLCPFRLVRHHQFTVQKTKSSSVAAITRDANFRKLPVNLSRLHPRNIVEKATGTVIFMRQLAMCFGKRALKSVAVTLASYGGTWNDGVLSTIESGSLYLAQWVEKKRGGNDVRHEICIPSYDHLKWASITVGWSHILQSEIEDISREGPV